jgi:hypothetical protein
MGLRETAEGIDRLSWPYSRIENPAGKVDISRKLDVPRPPTSPATAASVGRQLRPAVFEDIKYDNYTGIYYRYKL